MVAWKRPFAIVGRVGLLAACSLSLSLVAFAQETTPEPTLEATAEAAVEATPEMPMGLSNSVNGNAVITETLPFEPGFLDRLQLPEGFEINVFGQNLGNVRIMAVAPDGTILITRRAEGDVIAVADQNGDGVADSTDINVVASDLPLVHGITIQDEQVYLATDTTVYVADLGANGSLSQPQPIISDLPVGGQHPNRTLAFGPDELLYITVGSTCNACDDAPDAATIQRAQRDGTGREPFAVGLRNTIGFGWHPETGEMWGMDQGSDWLGDDIPPEELNRIVEDTDYGWPWCYADQQPDLVIPVSPPGGQGRAAFCQTTTEPVLTYTAHSAPISMLFYTADQFPVEYQNSAFITMRGSWNRQPPSGYEVVRLTFDENGQPTGFEDFLTGFLVEEQIANIGRIAGLAIAPDGSLLITEDTNGIIYRVAYTG